MENDVVKKPLTIIIADGSTSHDYLKYLDIMFDVKVIKFEEIKGNQKIDLVLFTGGEDVNPSYYNQNKGNYTFINKDRDKHEREIFDTFYHTPKLGICRGAQFLTVMSGGELVQHVTGHTQAHTIFIENYGDYTIPSTHHQMMFPFKMDKDQYKLIGYASKFRSNTYLNGDNEEIKLPADFLEPEIIEYKNTNSFCIQGHPEFDSANEDIKKVTLQLILNWLDPKSAKPFPKNKYIPIGNWDEEITWKPNVRKTSGNIITGSPGVKLTASKIIRDSFYRDAYVNDPIAPETVINTTIKLEELPSFLRADGNTVQQEPSQDNE